MKLSFLFILFSTLAICQSWTAEELAKANTCANTSYLTKNEKEAIYRSPDFQHSEGV